MEFGCVAVAIWTTTPSKNMREGEQRFVDLSPGLMALLDHLVLKHNFDTDHGFAS